MGIDKTILNKYFLDDLIKDQMLTLQKKIRELLCVNLTLQDQNLSLNEKLKKDQDLIEELMNKDSKPDIVVENLRMKITDLNQNKMRDEEKIIMLMKKIDTVNKDNEDLKKEKEDLEARLKELIESKSVTTIQHKMLKTPTVTTLSTESSSNIVKEINTNNALFQAQTDIDDLLDDVENINDNDSIDHNLDELFDDSSATVGAPVEIKKEDVEIPVAKKSKKKAKKAKCQCEPCMRPPCDECIPCKDSPRNGGPGKYKNRCKERKCIGHKREKRNIINKKSKRRKQKEAHRMPYTELSVSKNDKNGQQCNINNKRGKEFKESLELVCPVPGCSLTFKRKRSRRIHISTHFKEHILSIYPWNKNMSCPICENPIKGQSPNFVEHVAYVHKVLGKLLPKDDNRIDFVKNYFV